VEAGAEDDRVDLALAWLDPKTRNAI